MSNNKLNSLGIAKPPQDTRVIVAMSGGVDSSVCAAMLHEEGYEVIGVTLKLLPEHTEQDAQKIAEALGIPFHVLDCTQRFKNEIIKEFAESYLRGETPIPCAHCNRNIKFGELLDFARSLGADCMATGHYIRREIDENGQACLMRGTDAVKDQSYFLFATSQEQLDFLRFPLGELSKDETREHAQRLGLITADKPESQDICFVPNGDYARLVKSMRPQAVKPGNIVHVDGRIVGEHKGIIHYTIGQRKGLGIGGGVSENNSPLYVVALDPEKNEVIVGPKEALAQDTLYINECNWLLDTSTFGHSERHEANRVKYRKDTSDNLFVKQSEAIHVKFRSVMKPTPARLNINGDNNTAEIYLETPQYGIAAGQAAVCYINNRMIGGGWIIKAS